MANRGGMQSSTVNIYSSRFPRPSYDNHATTKEVSDPGSLRFSQHLDRQANSSNRRTFSTSPLAREPQDSNFASTTGSMYEEDNDDMDDSLMRATTELLSSRPGSRAVVESMLGGRQESDEDSLARLVTEVAHNPLARLPPKLPDVDSHIQREELKYSVMRGDLRKERGVESKLVRKVRKESEEEEDESVAFGGFTVMEIKQVVRYIDVMNEDGEQNGSIDPHELESAFRRARRTRASAGFEEDARHAMTKLLRLMEAHNLTPLQWFGEMDQSQLGKGDGRITRFELERGLAEMCTGKAFEYMRFTSEELRTLVRYVDPNGDGDLTKDELNDAVRRFNSNDKELDEEHRAAAIMAKLETFMDQRQLRVKDLFVQLDEDHSGEISFKELQRGLVAMAAPSARLRALAKKRKQKEVAAEEEALIRMKMERELNERMERFEKSGAVSLLHKLEKYMHENNMRVKDLFTRSGFDKNGDGIIDAQEFLKCLKKLRINQDDEQALELFKALDESDDGEMEAAELEKTIRRLKKDIAFQESLHADGSVKSGKGKADKTPAGSKKDALPPIELGSEWGAAKIMARKIKMRARVTVAKKKVYGLDNPRKTNFDTDWLSSFDKRLDSHLSRAFSSI